MFWFDKVKIKPHETRIEGKWVSRFGRVTSDKNCKRISILTKKHLKPKSSDSSGWETLYQDPMDNRYWVHTYIQSHLHGGGPPSLIQISEKEARERFEF